MVNNTGMATVGEVVRRRVVIHDIIFREILVYTTDTDETMELVKPDRVIFQTDTDARLTTDIVGRIVK